MESNPCLDASLSTDSTVLARSALSSCSAPVWLNRWQNPKHAAEFEADYADV